MGRGLFIIVALLLGLTGVVRAEPEMRGAGVASSAAGSGKVALGEYRALIIGINAYAHPDVWTPLEAARADAEALRDVLVTNYGFKPENTQLLVDEAATREKIEGALYGLRKTTRPDDLIFIYFAGHGNVMGDPRDPDASCWIPYDAKSRTSCTDAVNHAVVRDLVKRFPARHTLVVADACFGGNLMEPTTTRGTRGGAPVSYVRPLKLTSKQILTSGVRKLEVSDKDPKTGHSPFASALLRSLRDSKGFVSTMDLTADVRRYYRGNQVKNEPVRGTMAGDAGGEFVFVPKEKLAEVRARVKSEREQIAELQAKLAEERENLQIANNIAQEKRRKLPPDTWRPSAPDTKVPVIPINPNDAVKGNKNAKVTIVEFSDFQCAFCSRAASTIKEIIEEYGDKVRVVFKHTPMPFHKNATLAAQAAIAAGRQGKFWQMYEVLFQNPETVRRWRPALKPAEVNGYAKEIGLNMDKFAADLNSESVKQQLAADLALAKKLNVRGIPHFFINGRSLIGAQPLSAFKKLIDDEL